MNRNNTKSLSLNKVNNKLDFNETLILVRDGVFNYLQFLPTKATKYLANDTITAKPVVTVKDGSPQVVVLDYSGANESNKNILDTLFANVVSGDTFEFSNAHYVNPITGEDVQIETTLQFKYLKEWIIKTEVVGATLSVPSGYFYDPVYFIDSPVLTFNTINDLSTNPNNEINELKNSIPVDKTNNLIKYLGILPGNYIKIVNSVSANNDTLFRVVSVNTDEYEHIVLDPSPEHENLIGDSTLIKLFMVASKPEAVKDIPFSNNWGCANILSGDTLDSFSYFSELQAKIKIQEYPESQLTFTPGVECTNVVNGVITGTVFTPETITTSKNTTNISILVSGNRLLPAILQVADNTQPPNYNPTRNTLTINADSIHLFMQSDISNTGNPIAISNDSLIKQPLFDLNGVKTYQGVNGVGTIIEFDPKKYVETTSSRTAYLYSTGGPLSDITINIIGEVLPILFRNAGSI
jgi:hypothetical protein